MNTPIADFVKKYADSQMTRFHMPGHKGRSFLGCEAFDITEVKGADSLYEAEGIIAKSEENATSLFGTERTIYSTEGSSQCIRAMLYLALTYKNKKRNKKPYVLAARNVHKAFLYAVALLDLEVVWLYPKQMHSLCSCEITATEVEAELKKHKEMPIAVYLTSPDYLGGQVDIQGISEVCHKYQTILAVDNAHGAYLHFLKKPQHPMDLGADICSDSAHKTLPVLTGGAYLQISKNAPKYFSENAKQAMALFGSTSPSYLIMSSMDLCNSFLEGEFREKLEKTVENVQNARELLRKNGWQVEKTEPLKLVVNSPEKFSGYDLADKLRQHHIECEYADSKYVVFMVSTQNDEEELDKLIQAFGKNEYGQSGKELLEPVKSNQAISIRQAIFSEAKRLNVEEAQGKICAATTVACPPAIPIVISGEIITEEAIHLLEYYGIKEVEVVN